MTSSRKLNRDLALGILFLVLFVIGSAAAAGFRFREWSRTHITRGEAVALVERMAQVFNAKQKSPEDVLALFHKDAVLLSSVHNVQPLSLESYARECASNRARYEQTVESVQVDAGGQTATVSLACSQGWARGRLKYSKTIVVSKRDGRVGIVRRERQKGTWEPKDSSPQTESAESW